MADVMPIFLGRCIKHICGKHGIQLHFRGGKTIKNLLVVPIDKNSSPKRVESCMDTNVTGWNAMENILVNPQEHLKRGSKNI